MRKLTSEKPIKEMNNLELAYNCCISEKGHAVYRDFEGPIDARDLARKLLDIYGVECFCIETDEDLDEFMLECLLDGPFTPTGLIALFYRSIWSMAELRGRLKAYEDTDLDPEKILEIDRLYTEKCRELAEAKKDPKYELKVGDILYFACYEPNFPDQSEVSESIVKDISLSGLVLLDDGETWIDWKDPEENMFLTRQEAETRIKELIKKGER